MGLSHTQLAKMSFDKIFGLTAAGVYFYFSSSEARRPTVSLRIVIVDGLADGILGVKHDVAAFVIQFLECYYNNAATCCCRPLSSIRWNTSSTR